MVLNRLLQWVIRHLPDRLALPLNVRTSCWNGAVDPEIRFLSQYIPQGRRSIALDVGANNGVTASVMSACFDHVYAFEPNPQLLRHWQRAAPRNVTPVPLAISDCTNEISLNIPVVNGQMLTGWASIGNPILQTEFEVVEIKVHSTTLDTFCSNHGIEMVDFIKIDVEGQELKVLAGARGVIGRFRPWMIVEHSDSTRSEIVEFLSEFSIHPITASNLNCHLPDFSRNNIVFRPELQ